MKTLFKIFVVVAALLAVFIVMFNVNGDVWKATYVAVVKIFGNKDGSYCLTPYSCVEVINSLDTLNQLDTEYFEQRGINAPREDRPFRLFKYDGDFDAFVHWSYK